MFSVTWATDPLGTQACPVDSLPARSRTQPVSALNDPVPRSTLTQLDGMINVIDNATRESCGGKQMRL